MITPGYQEQITQLHATKRWGNYGWKALPDVLALILRYKLKQPTVLDFGAGERTLEYDARWAMPHIKVTSYDPGIPAIAALPSGQFDIVVCTDVMEHVETQFVDKTLDAIRQLSRCAVYFDIACTPAKQHLPNGENAHVTIESPSWWMYKLKDRWSELDIRKQSKCLDVIVHT